MHALSAPATHASPRRDPVSVPTCIDTEHATLPERLLTWFDRHGRHDLPWQHPRTPYRVWLSEIMLQQTQVSVVIGYFQRFIAAFPTLADLAMADTDAVMAQWAGLGYYARARNLHEAAKHCLALHGGALPRDFDALHALPGIGRSTAGAILSQAWNERFPILDGNVKRLLTRVHGIAGHPALPAIEKQLWAMADMHVQHVAQNRLADYTQAQMDFGATLCTRRDPGCLLCPLQDGCVAHREGLAGSLPTPKPGKPLPERKASALLLENTQGDVLLHRRPATGIWASLWTLPQAETGAALRHWFATHIEGDYTLADPLPPIIHTFTHYRLHLQPLRLRQAALLPCARDKDDLRWVARSALATLGLPAPIRKLLNAL